METAKPSILTKTIEAGKKLILYLQIGIWRTRREEHNSLAKHRSLSIVKAFVMAVRRYNEDQLQTKASALTYNTLLAIVPLLAVLFGIARGFGFQNIVQSQLFTFLPGQSEMLDKSLKFVDSYLEQVTGGVFVGIGLALLLWTLINLLGNIEEVFNEIWRVRKSRTFFRKVTDYMSLFMVLPVMMILSGGISIFISTAFSETVAVFYPILTLVLKLLPYVIIVFTLTGIYLFIPNTHVKFLNAFSAALFSGTIFQLFQILYISGQIWVSKYNAIYGSFAALPLLLLWLQLSWLICLFGVELAAAGQNIDSFDFERDTRNISRRCKDFFTLMIAALIVKQFEKGGKPLTKDDISLEYQIPSKLTSDILILLEKAGVVIEAGAKTEFDTAYVPAIDINKISVAFVYDKIEQFGAEDFNIKQEVMDAYWNKYLTVKEIVGQRNYSKLIKDL
jgi:membrane protein